MEKEQIIKALECCIKNERENTAKYCENCPSSYAEYGDEVMCCIDGMCESAITLIKQQDEQIFQLENRLKECENGYAGTLHIESCKLHDAEERVKELTEENERLKTATEETVRSFTRLETLYKIECKRADTIKADTVREMQEKVKAEAYVPKPYGMSKVVDVGTIDRIAEEMLKSRECPQCKHFAGCEPSTLGGCDMYEEDEKE